MKPPFGNLEKLAFHTDPSHSEWIATRKAILIALTHQTRKQFFNLVIYVWPPSLKENMRTELVSTLETLRGRITKGTEADEDTLSILERPSFQALKRSDETLFQIIKLALKLKIPIEYHRLHSFNKGTEENSVSDSSHYAATVFLFLRRYVS